MQMASVGARNRHSIQAVAIFIIIAALVILADVANFRSLANFVWMIGAPAIIAICSNRGWDRPAFMIMVLIGVSWVTAMIVGVNFTSYG